MYNLSMDMFTIARALGVDDFVSPTIPFVPPNGAITPTPNTNTGPSILLESSVVSVKKGEKAKVRIVIFTDAQEVKEFSFQIEYDKSLFSIVDGDTQTAGTQIPYTNNFFLANVNSVDQDSGEIVFKATALSGTAPITNRVIAEFEVLSLVEGVSEFKIIKNSSSLVNSNNINILNLTNSINITVSGTTVYTSPSLTPKPTIKPTLVGGGDVTPKTALGDDFGNIASVVLGAFLVFAGFYFLKKKSEHAIQR